MSKGNDTIAESGWLERRFRVQERGSTLARELVGAAAIFLTLSYILFVQPVVMGMALPDGTSPEAAAAFQSSVLTALCLASAFACFVMAFLANFPVALAPAMGHNFFFSLVVVKMMGFTWQQALAANLVAGLVFLALSLAGMWLPKFDPRAMLFDAMPKGLINAIAVGIGLLIALVGFEYAGIVVPTPGTYIGLGFGKVPTPVLATAFVGLLVFGVLWARGVVGAPLWAILASAVVGGLLHVVSLPKGIVATPTLSATALQLDFTGLCHLPLKAVVIAIATFLFLVIFDTVGTLAAVCSRAGLISQQGRFDAGTRGAFVADAGGTVAGALLGTSTITSYVESLAGIQTGARTGLAALGVGVLFLVAMFFAPLLAPVAGAYVYKMGDTTLFLYPCLAPVLIGIGALMLWCVKEIAWDDATEALPAFLCIVAMPLTLSITDGIAFGLIGYVVLKTCTGRWREINVFISVCAALLAVRYLL